MNTLQRVVKVLEGLEFPIEGVRMSTNFATDLSTDSLDHVEIMMALEEEFELEPTSNEDDDKLITVRDVVEYIERGQNAGTG